MFLEPSGRIAGLADVIVVWISFALEEVDVHGFLEVQRTCPPAYARFASYGVANFAYLR